MRSQHDGAGGGSEVLRQAEGAQENVIRGCWRKVQKKRLAFQRVPRRRRPWIACWRKGRPMRWETEQCNITKCLFKCWNGRHQEETALTEVKMEDSPVPW